jgi:phosphoserine aminotransferase
MAGRYFSSVAAQVCNSGWFPQNLLRPDGYAAYVNTGVWASKAIKEAKVIGNTTVIASSEDKKFAYVPKGYEIPSDCGFVFISLPTIPFTEHK